MSETPRTDAAKKTAYAYYFSDEVVPAHLASDLEQQLAAARADASKLDEIDHILRAIDAATDLATARRRANRGLMILATPPVAPRGAGEKAESKTLTEFCGLPPDAFEKHINEHGEKLP